MAYLQIKTTHIHGQPLNFKLFFVRKLSQFSQLIFSNW